MQLRSPAFEQVWQHIRLQPVPDTESEECLPNEETDTAHQDKERIPSQISSGDQQWPASGRKIGLLRQSIAKSAEAHGLHEDVRRHGAPLHPEGRDRRRWRCCAFQQQDDFNDGNQDGQQSAEEDPIAAFRLAQVHRQHSGIGHAASIDRSQEFAAEPSQTENESCQLDGQFQVGDEQFQVVVEQQR